MSDYDEVEKRQSEEIIAVVRATVEAQGGVPLSIRQAEAIIEFMREIYIGLDIIKMVIGGLLKLHPADTKEEITFSTTEKGKDAVFTEGLRNIIREEEGK